METNNSQGQDDPVFLHSLWRSSSTYFWQKLRNDKNNTCFYEPFHEQLSHLTVAELDHFSQSTIKSLKHPRLSEGYFEEYRNLIDSRGVRLYHGRFALRDFVLEEEQKDEGLFQYVSALIGHARDLNRRPILQFCRSALRAAWLKRHFSGTHVCLLRDPRQQWQSFHEQAKKGNHYFLGCVLALAGLSRDHEMMKPLQKRVFLPHYSYEEIDVVDFYANYNESLGHDTGYFVFYYIWLVTTLQLLTNSDIVVDIDRISSDRKLQDGILERLSAKGLSIDLSDFVLSPYDISASDNERLDSIEAEVRFLFSAECGRSPTVEADMVDQLSWLSPSKRSAIEALIGGNGGGQDPPDLIGLPASPDDCIDRFVSHLWKSKRIDWGEQFGNRPVDAEVVRWCCRLLMLGEVESEAWVQEQLTRYKDLTVAQYRNLILEKSKIFRISWKALFWLRPNGWVPVNSETVIWCYRIFLMREPESSEAIDRHLAAGRRYCPLPYLINKFLSSEEYSAQA